MRLSHRGGREDQVICLEVLSFERKAGLNPGPLANLSRLCELLQPDAWLGEVVAVAAVFLLEPARAHPQDHASVRDPVQCRDDLGEQGRIAESRGRDDRAQFDPVRDRADGGECGPTFQNGDIRPRYPV